MRKLICSALMINCLVLTACAGTEQQIRAYAQSLIQADAARLTAQVQADHGDTLECYTLEYAFDGESWTALVAEPDILAGITVRIEEGGTSLAYEGVMLAAGNVLTKGVTAVGAVPLLWEALKTGSLDCVWEEGSLLAGSYVADDTTVMTLWYDASGLPVAAELTEQGISKVSCRFTNVEIDTKDSGHETTDETNLGGNQSAGSGT